MLTIGVTGTGSLVGQAIIKCIKASKYYNDSKLVGFDYVPDTIGSYWVDENIILPDITKPGISYETAVNALIGHLRDQQVGILFIGIDFDLPMYAAYRSKIESETQTKVIVNDTELISIADDKFRTFEFLKNNGFAYPETYLPGNIPNGFVFPAILKPRTGASSIGVSIIQNAEEAEVRSQEIKSPIVQELIGDANEEYTCGVVYLGDELVDSIVLKRTLKKGDTFKAEHRPDFPKAVYDYIHALAGKLKPSGVCNFQLRPDKNGVPKLFEINARHSGTTYFRCLFNYNEIEMILNFYFPVSDYVRPEKTYGLAMRFFEEKKVKTY
ncbi:MAG: ATP-grasp domain-containing protein [Ferruginibacter sp.]